jgi:CelD/BcsL family acetyltransferase involved in cellulose biosynthesis
MTRRFDVPLILVAKDDNFGVMPPDSTATSARIEQLSFEEFCRVEEAWDDLALGVASPVPFMCHTWLRLWWRHFGAGQEFVGVVVREGDRLLAAAPIAIRRGSPGLTIGEIVGTGPVPTRGMGLSDKADFLVRAGCGEAGRSLAAAVVELLERIDVLDIKGCDAGSPTHGDLQAAAPGSVHVMERSVSPYLALAAPWEDYVRSRSRNFRKHLKKYWRLLAEAGAMQVVRMESGADAESWMADVFTVNDASWKSGRGTNLFRSPPIRAFFAELVPAMAAKGRIDLHVVRLDGKPAVYELCFDFADRLFSYNGAYRADLGRGSPGTALTAAVIESACNRDRIEYDLLRGDEGHKLRWSETLRTELQVLVPAGRAGARVKTLLGPHLKARLKRWSWLAKRVDRLSGLASRFRYRD